jgi:cation/acetate symporter
MIAGIGFTAWYIIACVFFGMETWTFGIFPTGINPQGIGVIGMALNLTVTLGLTPFCAAPSAKVREMVDSVREPEDAGAAVEIETAPEH